MHCISPQTLDCVALPIRKLWTWSQILNLGHVTLAAPTLGGNLSYDGKILVVLNMPTKYEVLLNSSIDIEGVPKSPYSLTKFALRMRGIT